MGKAAQTAKKIAELQEKIWELENSLANDPAWGRAEIVQDIAESRWLDVQNDYRNGWLSVVVDMPNGVQRTVWIRYKVEEK